MSSIASYTSAPSESRSIARGRFARIGLATVVAAVLANTLFYYICSPFVHYDAEFKVLTNPSGAIIFTLVPAIVAGNGGKQILLDDPSGNCIELFEPRRS